MESITAVTPGVYFRWEWRLTEAPCTQGVTLQEVGTLEAGRGGGRRTRRPCFPSQLGQASWGSVYEVGLCGRRMPGSLVTSQEVATVPEGSHVSFLTKLGRGPRE